MPARDRTSARIDETIAKLRTLRESDRDAAFDFACEVVARERAHRALEPALAILTDQPRPEARPALRERFHDLTENGVRYDQDCALRVLLIGALRAIGASEDLDVARIGLRTVQLQPPGRVDVAQGLRAVSLIWLSEIEPSRVDYYAVEMLQDPHASAYTGEPAVTAIRVLAARGQILPIWALARRAGLPPDCLAQAFASLRKIPPDLQSEALLEHLRRAMDEGENGEGVALVAAEAIVLNGLDSGYRTVLKLLQETTNPNLLLYLLTTIVRSGDARLRGELPALQTGERDLSKRRVYDQVLGAPRARRQGTRG